MIVLIKSKQIFKLALLTPPPISLSFFTKLKSPLPPILSAFHEYGNGGEHAIHNWNNTMLDAVTTKNREERQADF